VTTLRGNVNGKNYAANIHNPSMPLLWVLRDLIGLSAPSPAAIVGYVAHAPCSSKTNENNLSFWAHRRGLGCSYTSGIWNA